MSLIFKIAKDDPALVGQIHLDGSKSISNRGLLIRALSGQNFKLHNLSTSQDSVTMQELLRLPKKELDVGPAGTTFRFLTAYLALEEGEQILTGSDRMKKRPIGPLVEALNLIGADISYMGKPGYPPLLIRSPRNLGEVNHLTIPANISSQFISALVMIAPNLPNGLNIKLEGKLVSASYLKMTLAMMSQFGVTSTFSGLEINIPSQSYSGKDYTVESDWSAASYHFALAALADTVDFTLTGLFAESLQGDAITAKLFEQIGVKHRWLGEKLHLSKNEKVKSAFDHDFILCPDIAQTMAVVLAAKGIPGLFTGLETLSIKETDRIHALNTELSKVNVSFAKMPARFSAKSQKVHHMVEGTAAWSEPPLFETYHDHRMAMAFAPLGILAPICISDPDVVRKSYPDFWKHLVELGFTVQVVDAATRDTK